MTRQRFYPTFTNVSYFLHVFFTFFNIFLFSSQRLLRLLTTIRNLGETSIQRLSYNRLQYTECNFFLQQIHSTAVSAISNGIIQRNRSRSASNSAYSYTFLHSVVCLSVGRSSVTFVHSASTVQRT